MQVNLTGWQQTIFHRPDIRLKAEAGDHSTDEEILALGRKHFHLSQGGAQGEASR